MMLNSGKFYINIAYLFEAANMGRNLYISAIAVYS